MARPLLGHVRHASGRLPGRLGAVAALAVAAEAPHPAPASAADGRHSSHSGVNTLPLIFSFLTFDQSIIPLQHILFNLHSFLRGYTV